MKMNPIKTDNFVVLRFNIILQLKALISQFLLEIMVES